MVSMASTVVGVFDDYTEAEMTRRELLQSGFREQQVRISERSTPGSHGEQPGERSGGFWDSVREFFGVDDEDTAYYEEASRRGGAIVTVSAGPEKLDTAVDIIERHHPVDIDRKAQEWRQSGWQGPQPSSTKGPTSQQERIPVAEERMKVGKRKEQRGGVRIYSRTTEQPVEQDINLREERVKVRRQQTDRPADESAFKERSIEAHDTREEPVVKKEARVKEEIVLDKDVEEHEATVRDTVRKQDVDIEDTTGKGRSRGKAPGSTPGRRNPNDPRR